MINSYHPFTVQLGDDFNLNGDSSLMNEAFPVVLNAFTRYKFSLIYNDSDSSYAGITVRSPLSYVCWQVDP